MDYDPSKSALRDVNPSLPSNSAKKLKLRSERLQNRTFFLPSYPRCSRRVFPWARRPPACPGERARGRAGGTGASACAHSSSFPSAGNGAALERTRQPRGGNASSRAGRGAAGAPDLQRLGARPCARCQMVLYKHRSHLGGWLLPQH